MNVGCRILHPLFDGMVRSMGMPAATSFCMVSDSASCV
jgi:hypothetical protein